MSFPAGTRASRLALVPHRVSGVKRPGHKDDHSPPFSAEVKNGWCYISTHLHSWYVLGNFCLFSDHQKCISCDTGGALKLDFTCN
jgi:hypothetical protein